VQVQQQQYRYVVGYRAASAGREGSVSVQAENVDLAKERALAFIASKTILNGTVIILTVRNIGKAHET
jgi:hypothetical protein